MMRRQAASRGCDEGLGRRTRRLSRLPQQPDLCLEDVNGAVSADQILGLLLVSGLKLL